MNDLVRKSDIIKTFNHYLNKEITSIDDVIMDCENLSNSTAIEYIENGCNEIIEHIPTIGTIETPNGAISSDIIKEIKYKAICDYKANLIEEIEGMIKLFTSDNNNKKDLAYDFRTILAILRVIKED